MQTGNPKNNFNKGGANSPDPDELTREVYGILGIAIDPVDMAIVTNKIKRAVAKAKLLFISTANLNFLVMGQSDPEFRESLLKSDVCTADGMPVVWLARLLGIPVRRRLAGADIFEALKWTNDPSQPLKIFIFGGAEGIASAACKRLNSESSGMTCVGSYYPGFTTIDEMSADRIIDKINSCSADFLAVALGAKKGQAWLVRNHDRIQIPVRVHLGATINFQAGALKRAPTTMQRLGLEWLWRIKEEPQLWRRYWSDGLVLLQLLLTRVLPLMAIIQWSQFRAGRHDLLIEQNEDQKSINISLNGAAVRQNIDKLVVSFQAAAAGTKDIVINFRNTCVLDARFLGLLIMLDKQLKGRHLGLTCTELPRSIERIFYLSGFRYLLHH